MDAKRAPTVRKPRQKTLLIAIAAILLVAALIAVVVVVIHNNQDNDNGPVQVGTIPGPIITPPIVSPPTTIGAPPTTSPPAVSVPPPATSLPPPSTSFPPPSTSVPPPSPPAVSNTILTACSDSLYRNSCISSLSAYPGASNANLTELAAISVEISLDESKRVFNFMDDLSRKSSDKKDKSVLEDCVELLEDSEDQLNNSLSTLRDLDSSSFQDAIGDVQTWLSAALTNPSTCVDGFQEVNSNMIPIVKARTENMTEFMSNALAVINKLSTTENLAKGHDNVLRTRRLLVDMRLQLPYDPSRPKTTT